MSNHKYLQPVGVTVAVFATIVTTGHVLLPTSDLLYREDGVLEYLSVGIWIVSALIAAGTAIRVTDPASRLMAIWLGWGAILAALRELDAHILMNPKYLGEFGVRYRLDWWFGSHASVWLRLGWAAFFIVVIGLSVYPPVRLRQRLLTLFRSGDYLVGYLLTAMFFLFLGFVVDDILRPVHFVASGTKQIIEETSEAIGALLFFAAVLFQWRRPLNQRLP